MCQASQREGLTSGEVRGTCGEVRRSLGNFRGTSASLLKLKSTMREVPGSRNSGLETLTSLNKEVRLFS